MEQGIDEIITGMIDDKVEDLVEKWIDPKEYSEDWDIKGLRDHFSRLFGIRVGIEPEEVGEESLDALKPEDLVELLKDQVKAAYEKKQTIFGKEDLREIEKLVVLQIIDDQWIAHLQSMEHMKEGIGLRGYGQLDPLREYQKEGYALLESLMDRIREEALGMIFRIQLMREPPEPVSRKKRRAMRMSHGGETETPATVRRTEKKVGRNEPCPCGSGKKYKKCCGANA